MTAKRSYASTLGKALKRVLQGGPDRSDLVGEELVHRLREYPAEEFHIHTAAAATPEATALREKLTSLLTEAGWKLYAASDIVGRDADGILILTKKATAAEQALSDYLATVGCKVTLISDRVKGPVQITIGKR